MPERDSRTRSALTPDQAAEYLCLPAATVEALARAGYLLARPGQDQFQLVDLKAFLARNAHNGAGPLLAPSGDPQPLLAALDGRAEEMAGRALEIFSASVPEARGWSSAEQARFVAQSAARVRAILAVTGQGEGLDESLVDDLQDVGAGVAGAGSSLPQLLVLLRISRDLVVQTAVTVAEEGGCQWAPALSLLLARVLSGVDRLMDALAQGYWAAVMHQEGVGDQPPGPSPSG